MLLEHLCAVITPMLKTHKRLQVAHRTSQDDARAPGIAPRALHQLPTSPQLTLPVSHLKLRPHADTCSSCTLLALSHLCFCSSNIPWHGMPCPSFSYFKTQHKWPFLQEVFPTRPGLGQASVPYTPQTPSASASITAVTKVFYNFLF